MEIIEIDNIYEIKGKISDTDKYKWIFRGLKSEHYQLSTTLARNWDIPHCGTMHKKIFDKYLTLLKEWDFIDREVKKNESLLHKPFWAYGQHYRLYTNLLDWTTELDIACKFALNKSNELVSEPFEDERDNEDYEKKVEDYKEKVEELNKKFGKDKPKTNARRCIYALKVCEDMVNKKQADSVEGYLLSIFDPANTLGWNKDSLDKENNKLYETIVRKNDNIRKQKGLFSYCKKMINDDNQSVYSLNDYFENNKHHEHYPSCNIELIQFVF
tara:strand:- start:2387 stop:3199 length:813 start_codon:yes stop_codon:yes gene_type:complete